MLGSQPIDNCQLCFPLKMHASGSDLRLYDGSNLKAYLLMRGLGPDAVSVVSHTGFNCWIFLLRHSVVCIGEPLFLFYLLFISQFACMSLDIYYTTSKFNCFGN